MEFKTVLMICSVSVFVITILRRIAKDEVVDLIGATVVAVLFILRKRGKNSPSFRWG